jgi:1,2-diacylglycerol 3-alpha-glucosyltransferase
MIPSKGMHLLIDAFHRIKAEIPRAKLIIVGKPAYPGYEKTLHRIADDAVIFAGEVSDEELPYYYAACDVYATASLLEGFNIPLVEAQACGKPVVAFDTGPHPEVVDDGKTGILVPLCDTSSLSSAIIKLLQDKELINMMGNQGTVMVRKRFCLNQAQ